MCPAKVVSAVSSLFPSFQPGTFWRYEHLRNAKLTGGSSKAAVCGATTEQLRFLAACCIAMQYSDTVKGLFAQIGTQDAQKLALLTANATFYACAAHPTALLCSEECINHAVQTLMTAVLSDTSGPELQEEAHLMCAAFQAADELALYYSHDNTRQATVQADTAKQPPVADKHTDAAAESDTPVCTAIPSAAAADQGLQGVETDTKAPSKAAKPFQLAEGYLPMTAAAFEQIQTQLPMPCNVDTYAVPESALCNKFVVPGDPLFTTNGDKPTVYWFQPAPQPPTWLHAGLQSPQTVKSFSGFLLAVTTDHQLLHDTNAEGYEHALAYNLQQEHTVAH